MERVLTSCSATDTEDAGRELATRLGPGDVVLISGGLGAGKTVFVRGLAAGLGVGPGQVSSPTFTLVHEYRGGRTALYHVDLYRLDRREAAELGIEEAEADGVVAVEWPERLADPGPSPIRVRIELGSGEGQRRITIADRDAEEAS